MNNTNSFDLALKEKFKNLRVITINNEPWFVGKDIAKSLGYKDTKNALKQHLTETEKIKGERNTTPCIVDNLGRKQYPTLINESGVYSLILGSNLKDAKRFQRWITSEVLPSIRKYGCYIANQESLSTSEITTRLKKSAESIQADKIKQQAEEIDLDTIIEIANRMKQQDK